MAKESNQLYEEILDITYRYLGPPADRFVTRQCESHLNKKPEQVQEEDIKDLIIWFSLAMGILSEDPEVVKQFESELRELTK